MAEKLPEPKTLPPRPKGKDPLIGYRTGFFTPFRLERFPREVLDAPPPKSRWRRILNYFW